MGIKVYLRVELKGMTDWNWTESTLAAIVKRVMERNEDTKDEEDNAFNRGRHQGYWEVIDMIKNDIESRGYDFDDFMRKFY